MKFSKKYSIFFRFWERFNIHLRDPEKSESTAFYVKTMIINGTFWNKDVKENLICNKTGPKVGIKMNFALESNFTTTFGSVFLANKLAMLIWFNFFFIYYNSYHMQGCTIWFFWVPQMYIKHFSKPEENWFFFKNFKTFFFF